MSSINPYESPQTTGIIPMALAGADWDRMRNEQYDATLFPGTIPFQGKYRILDFDALIGTLHKTIIWPWLFFVIPSVIFGLVMMWAILENTNWSRDWISFVVTLGVLILLVGLPGRILWKFARWRQARRIFNPLQGEIHPSGISLTEKRQENDRFQVEPMEFYPWEHLYYLEETSKRNRTQKSAAESFAGLPLPSRIVLHTKSDRNKSNDPVTPAANILKRQFFYEIICLEQSFFADPNDWKRLIEFLRLHFLPRTR